MQKYFQFDINRCTGCSACVIACAIENGLEPGMNWRQVTTFNERRHPGLPVFHLSLACNHCLDPPCMKYCPANAISKNADSGAVLIDSGRCIGCRYCSWVCPYDAPRYNGAAHVMEKCTFCSPRLNEGRSPSCVLLCPTGALEFGDAADSDMPVNIPGFPETGIKPAVRFTSRRDMNRVPEFTAPPPAEAVNDFIAAADTAGSKITLAAELPLALFTMTASALTGAFAGSLTAHTGINPLAYLGTGLLGFAVSAAHLGRKKRAYRALLNWRHSWLSREVILYILFLCLSGLSITVVPDNAYFGWAAALIGFAGLISIDKVYQAAPQTDAVRTHSAHALLNGLYLTGVFAGNTLIFGWFGMIKLLLYILRKRRFRKKGRNMRLLVSALRLGLGFFAPIAMWYIDHTILHIYIIACAVIGEIIDRSEYYAEFEVLTPQKQAAHDFQEMVQKHHSGKKLKNRTHTYL